VSKQLTLQTLRSSTCVITLVCAGITMATTYEACASTNYRQTTNWDYEVTRKPQIQTTHLHLWITTATYKPGERSLFV